MNKRKYTLGWLKDPIDIRDFHIRRFVKPVSLPTSYTDLISQMPPIHDQGDDGACVAFAAGYIKDWQEMKEQPGHAALSREMIS